MGLHIWRHILILNAALIHQQSTHWFNIQTKIQLSNLCFTTWLWKWCDRFNSPSVLLTQALLQPQHISVLEMGAHMNLQTSFLSTTTHSILKLSRKQTPDSQRSVQPLLPRFTSALVIEQEPANNNNKNVLICQYWRKLQVYRTCTSWIFQACYMHTACDNWWYFRKHCLLRSCNVSAPSEPSHISSTVTHHCLLVTARGSCPRPCRFEHFCSTKANAEVCYRAGPSPKQLLRADSTSHVFSLRLWTKDDLFLQATREN